MTRIIAVIALGTLIGLLGIVVSSVDTDCSDSLTIRDQQICVEIRDTDPERQQGLSGRDPLPEKHGMLFVFSQPAQHTFWMKDMKFALDFLWIRDSRVVDISQNVPPPSPDAPLHTLLVYGPSEAVDQVLEVNAGTVAALGIATGDVVVRK